jgi:hypothetical protein
MTWILDNWLDLVGTILVIAAAWPANGIWRTLGQVPWQASEVGRVLFSKAAMIALVLDFTIVASVVRLAGYGRPLWLEILRLVLFLGVAVVLWWQRDVFRRLAADTTPSPVKDQP